MESTIQRIEEIYCKKISLFKKLLDCVILERDSLINLNIENLWSLMEEKQGILKSIEDIEGENKNIIEKEYSDHDIPIKERRPITALSRKITDLKEEIKVRVKENVSFIQESLNSFDEIISIFANGGRAEHSYGPIRNNKKELSPQIYHREV